MVFPFEKRKQPRSYFKLIFSMHARENKYCINKNVVEKLN